MEKTIILDDITGEEGATRREFSIGDELYEIDLVDSTHQELRKALAGFIESGRRVSKARKAIKSGSVKVTHVTTPSSSTDTNAIRDWARSKGMQVSSRGRVPKDIVDAFNAGHTPGKIFSAV